MPSLSYRGMIGRFARRPRQALAGVRRRPERGADSVQVAQDLAVRAEDGALVVGEAVPPAVGAHECLSPPEAGPGHAGEQVVLDLVVQAAEDEVGEPAAADVAGGEYLAAQVVELVLVLQD